MDEQIVVDLTEPAAQDSELTGGKGANLSRMVSASLPIPPGFVVTTELFKHLTAEYSETIAKRLSSVSASDSDTILEISEKVRRHILDIEIPRDVVAAIENAYRELGLGTVSVRSSATAEDLANASFAGQYSSFINVISLDDVIQRIREVWASLYLPHAIAYRIENQIPDSEVHMAVVVQKQLHSDASGVMFTRDPVTGADQLVINAAFGQGEGVVDGVVTPDNYTLGTESGEVITSDIADKTTMVIASSAGGTSQVAVPESKRHISSLSDSDLSNLFAMAKRVVSLFGVDQDIEFSIVEGELFLLQARPVTTGGDSEKPVDDWESAVDTRYSWVLHRVLSSRGPLYELQRDMARSYIEGQRQCFDETGSPFNRDHIATTVDGYIYVRPPDVTTEIVAERQARHARILDEVSSQGKSYFEAQQMPLIDDMLSKLADQRRSAGDFGKLVEYMASTIETWGYVFGHLHWCLGKAESPPEWPVRYHEITGEPSADASVFLQAIPNKTTQLTARLRSLARIVQSDPELSHIFSARDYDRLEGPNPKENPQVSSFNESFEELLDEYGQRTGWSFGSSSSYLSPTWNMNYALPFDAIAAYAEQDIDELERLENAALSERQNATMLIRRRLANDPDRLTKFNAGLAEAIRTVETMENHNHMMEQVTTGTMREAIFAVGKHLVELGQLDDPDDVFHLSIDVLRQFAKDDTDIDLREKVRARADEWEARARLNPPPTLGDGPSPENSFGSMHDLPDGVGLEGSTVKGVPASRGRRSGAARIVIPGKPLPQVHPGDILVAENAGAEWTPVMSILGGIVLDKGAVFQHAALVAREYRIPAVLMTGDATSVIKEGQRITVDGDSGLVELE